MPTSRPSGQPTGEPSAYPTQHIRSTVQLIVQQQVKGVTVADFDATAKEEYITAIVVSLEEEMPNLRTSMINITSVTEVVARRRNLRGRTLAGIGQRSLDTFSGLFYGSRGLGVNSISELEYEIVYVAEELGCSSCSTGQQADDYFRTMLEHSDQQAAVSTWLSTYSNTAALQAGITVMSTAFPNAYTLLSFQSQYPTGQPSSSPSSIPTLLPRLGPDKYASFFEVYGLILGVSIAACCCLSLWATFGYLYPSICTPWCFPCCLTKADMQRWRYAAEKKKHYLQKFVEKESARVRRTGSALISGKYKVAPLGASSPSKKNRANDPNSEYAPRVRVVMKVQPNQALRAQRIRARMENQQQMRQVEQVEEEDRGAPMKPTIKLQPHESAIKSLEFDDIKQEDDEGSLQGTDADADTQSLTTMQTLGDDDASIESVSPDKEERKEQ